MYGRTASWLQALPQLLAIVGVSLLGMFFALWVSRQFDLDARVQRDAAPARSPSSEEVTAAVEAAREREEGELSRKLEETRLELVDRV